MTHFGVVGTAITMALKKNLEFVNDSYRNETKHVKIKRHLLVVCDDVARSQSIKKAQLCDICTFTSVKITETLRWHR
jgi:hypothetical protein